MNSLIDTPSYTAPAKILVAENDEEMREYIAELLRSRGMQVEAADYGQKAINRVKRDRVDLTSMLQKIRRHKSFHSRNSLRTKGVLAFSGPQLGCTKDELIKAADLALAQSKKEGRDGIFAFQHRGYIYKPDSSIYVSDD